MRMFSVYGEIWDKKLRFREAIAAYVASGVRRWLADCLQVVWSSWQIIPQLWLHNPAILPRVVELASRNNFQLTCNQGIKRRKCQRIHHLNEQFRQMRDAPSLFAHIKAVTNRSPWKFKTIHPSVISFTNISLTPFLISQLQILMNNSSSL